MAQPAWRPSLPEESEGHTRRTVRGVRTSAAAQSCSQFSHAAPRPRARSAGGDWTRCRARKSASHLLRRGRRRAAALGRALRWGWRRDGFRAVAAVRRRRLRRAGQLGQRALLEEARDRRRKVRRAVPIQLAGPLRWPRLQASETHVSGTRFTGVNVCMLDDRCRLHGRMAGLSRTSSGCGVRHRSLRRARAVPLPRDELNLVEELKPVLIHGRRRRHGRRRPFGRSAARPRRQLLLRELRRLREGLVRRGRHRVLGVPLDGEVAVAQRLRNAPNASPTRPRGSGRQHGSKPTGRKG